MNDNDADPLTFADVMKFALLAIVEDLPPVSPVGVDEDEETHVLRECLCNLDQLLLADAHLVDGHLRQIIQPHARHEIDRATVHLLPVDDASACLFIAEEDILYHREIGNECQLLMNDNDTDPLTL